VQDEWDKDMDQIDSPIHDATVEAIEEETEQADEERRKGINGDNASGGTSQTSASPNVNKG
jgi:hypothetical protein